MVGANAVWGWITGGASVFVSLIKGAVGIMAAKVLATFGLTMISFNVLLPQLKAFVLQYAAALPPEAMNFLGAIGLGKAMSMVFSALTVRMASKVLIVPTSVASQFGQGP